MRALEDLYVLPSCSIDVRPCGAVRAFSSPDSTICSDLVADLWRPGSNMALYAIVMRQIGHALMDFWRVPGDDSAEKADAFVALSSTTRSRPWRWTPICAGSRRAIRARMRSGG